MTKLKKTISELRKHESQASIAERCRMSPVSFCELLSGKRRAGITAISRIYGVVHPYMTLDELVGELRPDLEGLRINQKGDRR